MFIRRNSKKSLLQLLLIWMLRHCVDFFFERGFPNRSCLQFVGEDERADFYDWAVELGCCLSLKETHQGESEEEKLKRKIDEEKRLLAVKKQKEKQQLEQTLFQIFLQIIKK